MADLKALYDDVMMDHIRNARNYREITDPDRRTQVLNRMCGDDLTVFLKLEGDRVSDVSFQCSCCGISMASASIMTQRVAGKSATECRALVKDVLARLRAADPPEPDPDSKDALAIYATVREFPGRINCASLAWHGLEAALEGKDQISVG